MVTYSLIGQKKKVLYFQKQLGKFPSRKIPGFNLVAPPNAR
jgi:hypothetical protein